MVYQRGKKMQVLYDRGREITRTAVLAVTGILLSVSGTAANTTGSATGSQGGLLVILLLGVLLFLGTLAVLGVLGYLFMTGSLSMQDLLPGNAGASPGPDQGPEDIRQAVSGQDNDSLNVPSGTPRQTPGGPPSPGNAGSQARPGPEAREGSGGERTGDQGSSGQQSPGQGQGGSQVSMEGLRRDTARIHAILRNRKNVEQREQILQELDKAMNAVDSGDLQEARASLDRIRQMLNMRD